jgi:hypothetical protein
LEKRFTRLPNFCLKNFKSSFKAANSLPDMSVLGLWRCKRDSSMFAEWT